MKEVEQSQLIYTHLEDEYNHNQILDMLGQNNDFLDFCKKTNISQYKSINGFRYVILKTNKGIFLILFDLDDRYTTMKQVTFSPDINRDRIASLNVGASLSSVQEADPNGQFDFLWHSWKNYPKVSYHYFESGECFVIKYEENVIIDIFYLTL